MAEKGKNKIETLIFDVCIVLLATVFTVSAWEIDSRGKFFPGVAGLVLLAMGTLQLLSDLFPGHRALAFIARRAQWFSPKGAGSPVVSQPISTSSYKGIGLAIASVVLFYILFRALSIYIAIPLLSILLLGLVRKESWRTVLLVALGGDLFIWLVFHLLLQTDL